jgi:hypothetical protein
MLAQRCPQRQWNMVAELVHQNVFEGIGMLVEQGFDISLGRAVRNRALAHRGKPYSCAAVILRIKLQHPGIDARRRLVVTGLFQRQRGVVGLGQFVVVASIGHQVLFRLPVDHSVPI